jgi:hypothetical protein
MKKQRVFHNILRTHEGETPAAQAQAAQPAPAAPVSTLAQGLNIADHVPTAALPAILNFALGAAQGAREVVAPPAAPAPAPAAAAPAPAASNAEVEALRQQVLSMHRSNVINQARSSGLGIVEELIGGNSPEEINASVNNAHEVWKRYQPAPPAPVAAAPVVPVVAAAPVAAEPAPVAPSVETMQPAALPNVSLPSVITAPAVPVTDGAPGMAGLTDVLRLALDPEAIRRGDYNAHREAIFASLGASKAPQVRNTPPGPQRQLGVNRQQGNPQQVVAPMPNPGVATQLPTQMLGATQQTAPVGAPPAVPLNVQAPGTIPHPTIPGAFISVADAANAFRAASAARGGRYSQNNQ